MMQQIPLSRMLLYFGLLFLLPLFFVAYGVMGDWRRLSDARREISAIEQRLISNHHRGMRNALVREQYRGADPMYLNRAVEPYPLLERERRALEELVENEPSLPNKEVLQRYEFLRSGANALSFAESVVQSRGDLRETIESLTHPVEIDGENLQGFLDLIEGEGASDRPQLLVTEFRLDRKETTPSNEVFLLDIKLLKREYSK